MVENRCDQKKKREVNIRREERRILALSSTIDNCCNSSSGVGLPNNKRTDKHPIHAGDAIHSRWDHALAEAVAIADVNAAR